jgi:hypothetical protein
MHDVVLAPGSPVSHRVARGVIESMRRRVRDTPVGGISTWLEASR